MTSQVHYLHECRACSNKNLTRFLTLPSMPFTDEFFPKEKRGQEFLSDIEVFICTDCFTAQTQKDIDVTDYYLDYQYSVGTSPTASHFMSQLAESLLSKFSGNKNDLKILEVGSGDGGQLIPFKKQGCKVLGYEPSSTLVKQACSAGIPTIQGLFTADSIQQLPPEFHQTDIILLSYTFDHLPQPRHFLATAQKILNKNSGLLVIEVHDLEKIFQRQEYCLFEHEHSIYLTKRSAQQLLAKENFVVIDFDPVPMDIRRGNSLIFVATPLGSKWATAALPAINMPEYEQTPFYLKQSEAIHSAIENLDTFVAKVKSAGKKIAGYGAGGRGVMTLAAMKNAHYFEYLVDKKPKGKNLFTPKSGLPLVDLEALKNNRVDEILVFSFGYMQEIQKELQSLGYSPTQLHSLIDILAGKN